MNENLEDVKLSLYNSEELEKIKNNPALRTVFSVLKTVPVIGELIDSTIDTALTRFQEMKREELLSLILKDSEKITADMVNDVEFIINFSKTLEAVNKLATNDKVKFFAGILKNSYFTQAKADVNEYDEYLYALSTMSYRQISILVDLYRHEKENVEKHFSNDTERKDNKLSARSKEWKKFMKSVTEKYSLSADEVTSILASISRTGFCMEITGAFLNYTGGIYYITGTCEKFVSLIADGI